MGFIVWDLSTIVENINYDRIYNRSHFFLPQFVCLEGLVTSISDMNPSFFYTGHRRKLLLLVICAVSFVIGIFMITEVRFYLFNQNLTYGFL